MAKMGRPAKDIAEKYVTVATTLPPPVVKRMLAAANMENTSLSGILRKACESFIAACGKKLKGVRPIKMLCLNSDGTRTRGALKKARKAAKKTGTPVVAAPKPKKGKLVLPPKKAKKVPPKMTGPKMLAKPAKLAKRAKQHVASAGKLAAGPSR